MIVEVGRRRDGGTRYWCLLHKADGTAKYGKPAKNCRYAHVAPLAPGDTLTLNLDKYQGGVALWGAVPPVYDTSSQESDRGVHVHARRSLGDEKEIDRTYRAVRVTGGPLVLINALVVTLQRDFRVPYVGVVIGLLLAALAFIFWKIDVRNRQLIKLAEEVIKYFESTAPNVDNTDLNHVAALFSREAVATAKLRSASPFWYFTCAKAFACVYWLVGATGIICAVILTI